MIASTVYGLMPPLSDFRDGRRQATNSPEVMTIPVGLGTVKNAYGVQYASEMASAMIGALPLLIVFMLFQRHIIRGFATSGTGGQ